jgi:tape measure domain-containing protein
MARRDLNVTLGLVIKDFQKNLKNAERSLRRTSSQFQSIGNDLTAAISLPVAGLGVSALKASADIEQLRNALNSITGSAEETEAQLTRIRKIAEAPGIGFEQAIAATLQLQGLGVEASAAEEAIKQVANVVAASGGGQDAFAGAVKQLNQIQAKNRVLQEDINILLENVPALGTVLQDTFGAKTAEGIRAAGVNGEQFFAKLVLGLSNVERVQGGLKNSFENFGVAIRFALADLGDRINKLFGVQKKVEDLAKFITGLVGRFKALPDEIQKNVIKFALLVAAIGPALIIFGKFIAVAKLAIVGLKALLIPFTLASKGFLLVRGSALLSAGAVSKFFVSLSALSLSFLKGIALGLKLLVNPMPAIRAGFVALRAGAISAVAGLKTFAVSAKATAIAVKGLAISFLQVAAPIVAAIAVVAAIVTTFLYVRRNADAFGVFFLNLWTKIKIGVTERINGIIDGLQPLFQALGIEVSKVDVPFDNLIDQPKFETFREFLQGTKQDAKDLVPSLDGVTNKFSKLKNFLLGGAEGKVNIDVNTEEEVSTKDIFANLLDNNVTPKGGAGAGATKELTKNEKDYNDAITLGNVAISKLVNSTQILSDTRIKLADIPEYDPKVEEAQNILRETAKELQNVDAKANILGENTSAEDRMKVLAEKVNIVKTALVNAAQATDVNALATEGLQSQLQGLQSEYDTLANDNIVSFDDAVRSISDTVSNNIGAFGEMKEKVSEVIAALAGLLQNTLQAGFDAFFTTVADGGKDALGEFLKAIKKTIKQVIAQLLSAIATAAVLAAIFTVITGGAGAGFGSLFKGFLSGGGLPIGLAEGGVIPPGFPNDTFPARLTSGEAVIPLDRLENMINKGGNTVNVQGTIRAQGSELLTVIETAQYNKSRG